MNVSFFGRFFKNHIHEHSRQFTDKDRVNVVVVSSVHYFRVDSLSTEHNYLRVHFFLVFVGLAFL